MRKNLVVQLIYRIVLCCASLLAILLSFGFFYIGEPVHPMSWEFLKYYTNISNYLVFIVSVAVTAGTARRVLKGEREGYNRVWRTFKFMTMIMILVTFLVVVFLLYDPFSAGFWRDLGNMSYHVVAPVLFILDYILFDEKRTISVLAPIYSLGIPLVYVCYVFLLGATVPNFTYPYFFLNVQNPAGIVEGMEGYMPPLGYGGVIVWILILLAVFTVLGYLLWLVNRIYRGGDGKIHIDFKNILFPLKKKPLPATQEEGDGSDETPAA